VAGSGSEQRPAAGSCPIVTGMQKVTGVGAVFLRGSDAAALLAWYAEKLGIDVHADYGGTQFDWSAGGSTTWAVFPADTGYFGRRDQPCMVNYRVDDLDAMLAQLRSSGVEVIDDIGETPFGRFGWAVDPEGNRFELWQPPAGR
jgi:predicted enzyme related to lactoylglutathione lyase